MIHEEWSQSSPATLCQPPISLPTWTDDRMARPPSNNGRDELDLESFARLLSSGASKLRENDRPRPAVTSISQQFNLIARVP